MTDIFDMTFTVPSRPVPKARPRLGKFGNVYTPKRTSDYEKTVREAFMAGGGIRARKINAPVHIKMYFYMPTAVKNKDRPTAPSVSRPDIDNLIKAILDGLNGVAYADDSQVFRLEAVKLTSNNPRTIVGVSWVSP